MTKALNQLEVVTLVVEDLTAARSFCETVFGLAVVYEGSVSAVVTLGDLIINLLQIAEASTLVTHLAVASTTSGARLLLTIMIDDADAVCTDFERHAVKLLNGPIDRPWARRTAAFCCPSR